MNKKQSLNKKWVFFLEAEKKWKKANVPGFIHTDLLNNKLIPDPFFGKNETELEWIQDKEWLYKLHFKPDTEIFKQNKIYLNFTGLDTYADIFLNDTKILSANNMFHPWNVEVKSLLKSNQNELLVKFRSPMKEVSSKMESLGYKLPADNDQAGGTSPHTRKAPYHYGWDWGPSLVTSGIWQGVELIGYSDWHIENLMITNQKCDKNSALLNIELILDSEVEETIEINIFEPKSKTDKTISFGIKKGENIFFSDLEILNPELWWPVGHGEQPLYLFTISVVSSKNSVVKRKKIGIRSVLINRQKDSRGESFEIQVNDLPIFSKGANWIPADSFTTRLTKDDYKRLITAASDANMNTLRIWGGGIYEPDCFYELCDELGILVWQDFMFACSMYPAEDSFLESVEKEVRYQVRRLKSFASVILWCGNNEIASAWISWGWKEELPKTVWLDYKKLFHELLPKLCDELDPTRLYWPSSPGHDLNLPKEDQIYGKGDNHYWGVWHSGEDFEAFEDNVGRFMSEYGMQSFPNKKTIDSFSKKEDQTIDSEVMNSHQKASLGTANLLMYIEKYYKMPASFNSTVELSQIMQAEAIKYAVEVHRRNMPFCMGTLYWQFNDCWPGISWSSIDYRGEWKALHYVAKHFYSPVLISIKKTKTDLECFLVNDQNTKFKATLIFGICSFEGTILVEEHKQIIVEPINSINVFSFNMGSILSEIDLEKSFVYCELYKKNEILSKNELFFVKPKTLKLAQPDFEFSSHKNNEGTYIISLTTKTFLYRTFVQCDAIEGSFSENYFNMRPGTTKKIEFRTSLNSGDQEKVSFKVLSLYDLQ